MPSSLRISLSQQTSLSWRTTPFKQGGFAACCRRMSRFVELIQFYKPRFLLLLLPNQTLSSFVFRSAIEDEVIVLIFFIQLCFPPEIVNENLGKKSKLWFLIFDLGSRSDALYVNRFSWKLAYWFCCLRVVCSIW